MKIECTVEELKEIIKENREGLDIKIDGEKVGKLIAPSISKEFAKLF